MATTDPETPTIAMDRRIVLRGAVVAAAAVPVLAACGGDEPTSTAPEDDSGGGGDDAEESPEESESPEDDGGSGDALAATSDIPVGGGKVFKAEKVVVTQPQEGTFKGFSATCTHKGCIVRDVADGTINCGCHGSKFSIEDGSVANPPAAKPLPEASISVDGDNITLA